MRIIEAINSLNRQGNARQIAEFIKKNYQYSEDILLEVFCVMIYDVYDSTYSYGDVNSVNTNRRI